jgi:hypothetical protein
MGALHFGLTAMNHRRLWRESRPRHHLVIVVIMEIRKSRYLAATDGQIRNHFGNAESALPDCIPFWSYALAF